MMRKFMAMLAAVAFTGATLAPTAADARDHRRDGYYDGGRHHGDYDRRGRGYYRDRDRDRDHGDAVAAGVVGLVLGLAIGSIASQSSQQQQPRYDDRRRYDERGYDPRYDDRSAYEQDYGLEGGRDYRDDAPRCMRRERQWDRYANRYVTVDVPC